MTDVVNTEDFLEHFGVKGMKWGKHSARSDSGGSSGGGKSRAELKALDRASAKKDADKHAAEVDAARERYATGARQKYLDAKKQYKADKAVIGKREAAKAFQKVKDENLADFEKASEYRDGKEATKGLLLAGAAVVTLAAINAALKSA